MQLEIALFATDEMFFFIPEFERGKNQEDRRLPFLNISSRVITFRSKSGTKTLTKSIINKICDGAGHVDGMKK